MSLMDDVCVRCGYVHVNVVHSDWTKEQREEMNKYHRTRSQLQERRVAEDLGGRVQAASGAMPHAKGDVRVAGDVRVECKTTTRPTYILQLATIKKIKIEGITQGFEDWVIQLEFKTQAGKTRFAIMDEKRAEEMGLRTDRYYAYVTDKQSIILERLLLQSYPRVDVTFVKDPFPNDRPPDVSVVVVPWATYLELRGTK